MTKEQALQILDQAAGMTNLSREGHVQVQEASKVLAEAIRPKEEPKKETKK